MSIKKIVIDAGRDSIKIVYINENNGFEKSIFSSKLGFANFDYLKTIPAISFDKERDIICTVDNSRPLIIGDTCDILLAPEKIIHVTSDEIYLKYAIYYILTGIAKFVDADSDVMLVLNLTYNNNHEKFRDMLISQLKGQHTIVFYDTKKNIRSTKYFNVLENKIKIFYQGWPSLMYRAIDIDTLKFNEKYLKDGIVIDIGRETTDVSLIRNLEPVKGISYEIATEDIFVYISEKLFNIYKVRKSTEEIERLVRADDIVIINNEEINIRDYLKEAVVSVAEQLKSSLFENFGKYTPYWVILTGGGILYFDKIFKYIYNVEKSNVEILEVLDEYIFSNALGMAILVLKYG